MDDTGAEVRAYYDALGEGEWDRLGSTVEGRASFAVHHRFLQDFGPTLGPGHRVLEVGAGPGRFTLELASTGAAVLVTDVSQVQLDLNRARVTAAGLGDRIEAWQIFDVRDSDQLEPGSFDAVIAYGGPLSYAFDREVEALAGLVRALRPGGVVVASVMSTLGALRRHLPGVVDVTRTVGTEVNDALIATGDLRDLPAEPGRHVCRMFRADEVRTLVAAAHGALVATSASGLMGVAPGAEDLGLGADVDEWGWFIDTEVQVCRDPGVVGAGTHLLFACTAASGS